MNKSKARKKQGRVARRPQKSPSPAANDEHTNIIDSLRKELKASKGREKELAEEFTNNFKALLRNAVPPGLGALGLGSTLGLPKIQMPKIDMPNVPFGLDELPMDKMAETAENLKERLNSFKLLEELEIKSAVDGLKHQANHQMKQLIANSQEQIREIQNVLKDKVGEIESLKKNVDAIAIERDQYKKQVHASMGTITSQDGSLPGSPATFSISPMKGSQQAARDMNGDLTPLQKMHTTQKDKNNRSAQPKTLINAMAVIGGSIARGTSLVDSIEDATDPSSGLGSLFQMAKDPNLDSMQNMLQAVDDEFIDNVKE